MNKKILLAGGSGLVGSNILTLLNNSNVELTLLSRRALEHKIGLKQIVSDFDNLHKLNGEFHFDEVYIAIGKKLSLSELIYIKKHKRENFIKVDFDYIKNVAFFAKSHGAQSIGLISAVGANKKSKNIYLKVKGKIESEIISMGFNKTVIARPGHLLGKRKIQDNKHLIWIFEKITNLFGYLLIGKFKQYRNVFASSVANTIVSKIDNVDKGLYFLNFDDFKDR